MIDQDGEPVQLTYRGERHRRGYSADELGKAAVWVAGLQLFLLAAVVQFMFDHADSQLNVDWMIGGIIVVFLPAGFFLGGISLYRSRRNKWGIAGVIVNAAAALLIFLFFFGLSMGTPRGN